jgi:hypothetical protein
MKDFTTTGKTAMDRYHQNPPKRGNNFDEFVEFCEFHKHPLRPEQREAAAKLFAIPYAKGKSTLIALLLGYDFAAQIYEEEYFNFLNNGRSPVEARACLQDIQSLVRMLHEKCGNL